MRLGSARPTARTAKRGESDLRAFDKNWRNYGGAALKGQSGSRNRGEGCLHMINKTVRFSKKLIEVSIKASTDTLEHVIWVLFDSKYDYTTGQRDK